MNGSKPESPTNILALVALAALLIFAAAAVGSMKTTAPAWISPEAADEVSSARVSASSLVAAASSVTPVSTGDAQPKCIDGVKGGCEGTTVTDNPKPGIAQCYGRSGVATPVSVNYACAQVGNEKVQVLRQTGCSVPGFEYTIRESKGNVTVTPRSLMPGAASCTLPSPPICADKKPAIASLSTEPCKVIYCIEAEVTSTLGLSKSKSACFEAKLGSDPRLGAIKNLAGGLTSEEANAVLPELMSSLSKTDQDVLNEAFGQQQDETQKQKAKNDSAIDKIQSFIDNCKPSQGCDKNELDTYIEQRDQLARQNAGLDKQMKGLAAAQKTLVATPPEPDSSGTFSGIPGQILPQDYYCIRNLYPLDILPLPAGSPWPLNCLNGTQPSQTLPSGPGGTFGDSADGDASAGGGGGGIAQFLQGFMKSLFGGGGAPPAGNQTPKAPGTCSPQTMCSNGTLFSRSNQCVDTPIQQCPNGCAGNTCAQASRQPVAQLSCQPQIADVGMSIAITYACSAGMSVGSGFDTGGASSGATTATLTTPPIGTNTASYGLTCTNQGLSANASCSVQIGKPSIVLVTNPKTVPMNTAAAIGWVTAGMQSCVIGSPDLPDFTSANAGNTNVNGAVTTPALTGPARFILHCVTLGGGTRDASSTIEVAGVAGAVSLAISKPTAGQNVALGGTVQIAWNSEGAPSGAKMRLEVYPAGSAVVQGNNDKGIVSALPASGTFTWSLPAAGAACLADSGIISCLTAGQYKIVAKLYTGSECWGFCTAAASERTIRVVAESSVFTIAP